MAILVGKLAKDMNLEVVVRGREDANIDVSDISRPGLQFAGHFDCFAYTRIQVLGNNEWSYLDIMEKSLREERIAKFFEYDMPCLMVCRGLKIHDEIIEQARKRNVWVLKSNKETTRFISSVMSYIDRELAETKMMHGVLVNVYGIGILITGESGVGKSEAALELIKRGHILISDDAVEIKCIDDILYGTSPYITSGMLEVRGMGIIDVSALYGLSSIIDETTVDFVIHLEQWKDDEEYERLGIDEEKISILGVEVKSIKLPIRPGRNVAVIVEAAAANYRYSVASKESPVDKINRRISEVMNGKNEVSRN